MMPDRKSNRKISRKKTLKNSLVGIQRSQARIREKRKARKRNRKSRSRS
jgi:hypothetical protein